MRKLIIVSTILCSAAFGIIACGSEESGPVLEGGTNSDPCYYNGWAQPCVQYRLNDGTWVPKNQSCNTNCSCWWRNTDDNGNPIMCLGGAGVCDQGNCVNDQ